MLCILWLAHIYFASQLHKALYLCLVLVQPMLIKCKLHFSVPILCIELVQFICAYQLCTTLCNLYSPSKSKHSHLALQLCNLIANKSLRSNKFAFAFQKQILPAAQAALKQWQHLQAICAAIASQACASKRCFRKAKPIAKQFICNANSISTSLACICKHKLQAFAARLLGNCASKCSKLPLR